MRKLAKSLFLVLVPLLLLHDVLTFSVNNFGRRSLSSSSSSFTAKKPSWSDDSNIIRDNLPQITHDLVHRLVIFDILCFRNKSFHNRLFVI